ncbi:prolipoprotein diacylglyceryl transferase [Citromicrobium sp. JLT1363]|jgi:phosphatidylglycerol:prolipoprotein diacylglycerol transferase|uniref:prolipoprotein diacylglyceryl transferase n=1 Tax=Citromicrobium sp. JLT1363 TaxID=517722 RepID=UPI000225E6AC|nr:prolipoprotein diacylglyceryl transferase [Citromicrobium sp. JLT1363]|tara:strand:- start:1148 stop:2035 length:888 start_codon:yes stop_codon:yes gene_type:complete
MLSLLAQAASEPIYWEQLGLTPGIDLGFFTLRWYSLAYIVGIILAYWHLTRMIKAPGAPMTQTHADDLLFYCTLGVIFGGRLGYALFYKPDLFLDFSHEGLMPWGLLRLWDGGMSFHGGVIGVVLALLWVSMRNNLNWLRVADYIAVNVPFGMFFGRLANFVNGELYGRPADVPWAMVFPSDPSGLARHPSQLYQAGLEGLAMMIIMLALFWLTKARWKPGVLVGVFTIGIATARFINEFFRQPDAHLTEFAASTGLSMGQWLSIPMILVGVAVVIYALRNPSASKGAPLSASES